MEPGSLEKLYLAVKDIDAAREDLVSRGVDVSEVEEPPKPPGFDLPGRSYFAYASFSDPDGNSWLVQETRRGFRGASRSDPEHATAISTHSSPGRRRSPRLRRPSGAQRSHHHPSDRVDRRGGGGWSALRVSPRRHQHAGRRC
jgi:hypothetical protein